MSQFCHQPAQEIIFGQFMTKPNDACYLQDIDPCLKYIPCNGLVAHCCVFRCVKTMKNTKMMKKVPFSSCAREAHERLTKKNEEKSLLVSDWE